MQTRSKIALSQVPGRERCDEGRRHADLFEIDEHAEPSEHRPRGGPHACSVRGPGNEVPNRQAALAPQGEIDDATSTHDGCADVLREGRMHEHEKGGVVVVEAVGFTTSHSAAQHPVGKRFTRAAGPQYVPMQIDHHSGARERSLMVDIFGFSVQRKAWACSARAAAVRIGARHKDVNVHRGALGGIGIDEFANMGALITA